MEDEFAKQVGKGHGERMGLLPEQEQSSSTGQRPGEAEVCICVRERDRERSRDSERSRGCSRDRQGGRSVTAWKTLEVAFVLRILGSHQVEEWDGG